MRATIHSAAVLGAGTMGAQIAAHLANAGIPVVLLDVSRHGAASGLARAQALKPDPFFTSEATARISTGGFDDDLHRIAGADWVIEAVVERLTIKQGLLARVEQLRRPGSIVSSNTSGIPIAALADGRSDDFRRHFLGTHFFNPPRYLKLLELTPTPDTDPAVVSRIASFADHRLGKGTVTAKDSPSFIANRLGLFGVIQILRLLESGEYSIEELDAMTGPAIGRPKSATFRTMDIAGLDILAQVTEDLRERLGDAESHAAYTLPAVARALVDRGWIGEKAGQGFYKREGADILTLDASSMTYRPKQPARLPPLDHARGIENVRERVRTLFLGADPVGTFLRRTLGPFLVYAAEIWPSIAHSIDDIDRAMRWGFGWELGPFELWDAIGVRHVLDATAPVTIPAIVADALGAGRDAIRTEPLRLGPPDLQILSSAREAGRIITRNAGASLVDIGDGVLAVEFHSKMNAIGEDTIAMIHAGLQEASTNFQALVIGNDAPDFSAGANLMLVLLEAQEGNWDEIDRMVRGFQRATLALRYSEVPVIIAPAGMALGGGCEIALHGAHVQAAAECYIGLVEVGVGLIPAGGGTKEMLARAMRGASHTQADPLPFARRAFETIAFAKVSSSADHARQLGYLRDADGVTMRRERVMADAKARALSAVREGYRPPMPEPIAVGGERVEAALVLGVHLAWRAGRISDHDARIGRSLARVIAGGSLPHAASVCEGDLLDLEREAFLSLCGERKTLERIQHTLKTGKPLRN